MQPDLTRTRLEQAFAASGFTQAELARASGIDRGSISLYLSGRYCPKADKLIRLAAALSVSPEWLSGLDSAPTETALSFPVMVDLAPDGTLVPGPDTQLIPRAQLEGKAPEDCFVLQMKGFSMYPRILEGDRLLVKRTRTIPDGAIAVFVHQGSLLVRQVQGNLLQAANPEYPPHPRQEGMTLLGRAITLIRAL